MQKVVVRDIGVAAAVIAALIAVLPFIGGAVLWTRPLWMDENVTVFVVSQPTIREMIGIIGRGGDWNPPLLHLLLRPLSSMGFENPPVYLRTFSVICVGLALLFVFAALRRRFSATSSAAGVVAVAAH